MFAIRDEVYGNFKDKLFNIAAAGVVYGAAAYVIQILNPAAHIQLGSFFTFVAVACVAKKLFQDSSFFKRTTNNWDKHAVIEVLSAGVGYGACILIGTPVTAHAVISLLVLGVLTNLVSTQFKYAF